MDLRRIECPDCGVECVANKEGMKQVYYMQMLILPSFS